MEKKYWRIFRKKEKSLQNYCTFIMCNHKLFDHLQKYVQCYLFLT